MEWLQFSCDMNIRSRFLYSTKHLIRVERNEARLGPARSDVAARQRGLSCSIIEIREMRLTDGIRPSPVELFDLRSVGSFERSKETDIARCSLWDVCERSRHKTVWLS